MTSNSTDERPRVLECRDVERRFGGLVAVTGVNMHIHQGEIFGLVGPNGSGKTTMTNAITGFFPPQKGQILLNGENITGLAPHKVARMGVVRTFQETTIFKSMTVRENLEFALRQSKVKDKAEIDKLVEEALDNVGLKEAIDKMPSELSGGMRKRAGLARTIIMQPELILYDEPTTGLDPITSREISELILEIQKKYKTSSLIITHDIECAKITANRIIVLRDGVVTAEGTFEELENSEDEWVRSFFNK